MNVNDLLTFPLQILGGVFDLPWWGYVVYTLVGNPYHHCRA